MIATRIIESSVENRVIDFLGKKGYWYIYGLLDLMSGEVRVEVSE